MRKPTGPIAVAIAACDRPETLLRCLDALLEGELLPAEIIVVDQSRESSVETALLARTGDLPLRYIRQSRLGLSASRNAALAETKQALISFTDDDCVPDRGWLAALNQALLHADRPTAVTGRVLPLGEDRPGAFAVSSRTGSTALAFRGRSIPWAVGTGANFAAHREWLLRVGGFDERLGAGSAGMAGEDAELLYRLLVAGATIRYVPEAVIYHERQGMAQRLASRRSYGHGIGALCALWVRRGDRFAIRMMLGWLRQQCWALLRAGVGRDWFMVRQRFLGIRGCARGFTYGLRVAGAALRPLRATETSSASPT